MSRETTQSEKTAPHIKIVLSKQQKKKKPISDLNKTLKMFFFFFLIPKLTMIESPR